MDHAEKRTEDRDQMASSELTAEDWSEIDRITLEIMDGFGESYEMFEEHVRSTIARAAATAGEEYEERLKAEQTHHWRQGDHPISDCAANVCRRWPGQHGGRLSDHIGEGL